MDSALRRADDEWRASLQSVVDILPSGFESPSRTSARLTCGSEEFRSQGFVSSGLRRSRAISAGGQRRGEVEVCITISAQESTLSFAPEEESLISGVRDRVEETLARWQAEAELRDREEFVQSLVDSSPVPLFTIDAEGRVLSWNAAAERTFGWPADDVVSRAPPIWPDDRKDELADLLQRALVGESLSGLRLTCRRHDGDAIDISLAVSPVKDRAGGVRAILFAVQDFADPSGMGTRNLFQARLLDAVGQAIIATDLEGTVTYWNRAAEDLYGWSSIEALGRSILELTPSLQSAAQAEEVMATLRRGESWTGEFTARYRDGSPLKVLVSNAPVMDDQGALVGVIGVSTDVSILKNLEAQIRQSQKMEAIGRLAGGIAHDFNNILTVIQGHAEMLRGDLPEDSPFRMDLEEVIAATHRATKLTRPLLSLSRGQALDVKIHDLRETTRRMESMLTRLVPGRIELSFELAGDPEWIRADVSQLDQVILNLVVNAVTAIRGRGTIRVAVDRCELSREQIDSTPWDADPGIYARLSVTDSGGGMDPETVERIFEPFFTTRPPGQGTGLGLSILSGIVRQGGGYVLVDSAPGRGTTFEVIWPRVESPGEALEPIEDAGSEGRESSHEGQDQGVVLIVDDEPSILRIMTRMLEQEGYRPITAMDGEEAFRVAQDHHPGLALVISDVDMPVMGGGDLLHRLRSSFPDLPIVLMSGHMEGEAGEDVRALASGFLAKPFGSQDLMRVVRAATSA